MILKLFEGVNFNGFNKILISVLCLMWTMIISIQCVIKNCTSTQQRNPQNWHSANVDETTEPACISINNVLQELNATAKFY